MKKKLPDPEFMKGSPRFKQNLELDFDNILEFVLENIKKKTFSSILYFFSNFLLVILLFYSVIHDLQLRNLGFEELALRFLSGMIAGSFLVIPFHEGFHALAYKIAGAPRIHYGADFRQMIFYVTADHYVLDRKSFYFLAYTPFILINAIAIILFIFTDLYSIHSLLFFLLFHNVMCIGDFAMVSYYQVNNKLELFTFDDVSARKSFIYEKLPYGITP